MIWFSLEGGTNRWIKESLSYDTTKAKKDGDTNAVSIDIVSMTLPNNQYRIVLEGETKWENYKKTHIAKTWFCIISSSYVNTEENVSLI